MRNSKRTGCTEAMSALASLVLVGCGESTELLEDDVATEQSELISNITVSENEAAQRGLVAIYHPKLPEFAIQPRPCSGVIVRSSGGQSIVLTARHCVTLDGLTGGVVASPSQIRFVPGASPGRARCPWPQTSCPNPTPPASSIAASAIVDFGPDRDIVVVTVPADWSSIANNRLGLYIGRTDALMNRQLSAYGYGINNLVTNCNDLPWSVSGAGTARVGTFVINEVSSGANPIQYRYAIPNLQDQRIMCGDSGGPDQADLWGNWRYILGIHSSGISFSAKSIAFDLPVQQAMGGVFLSVRKIGSASVPELKNVAVGAGGKILMAPSANAQVAAVMYDVPNRRILFGGSCMGARLNAQGQNEPFVTMCNASDPQQQWLFDPSTEIRNLGIGQCMTALSDSNVALSPCNVYDDRQRRLFHPQR
jgi:hypothetical protein